MTWEENIMHDPNYVKFATGFFALLNPFVLIPVFLALTGEMEKKQRMNIAFTATFAIFIIMTIAIFGGSYMLEAFGISVNDFQIAGGIVIFLMSISMVRAKDDDMRYSHKEHAEAKEKSNIAVVPLAIPLMAGPASISAAIIDSHVCDSFESRSILVAIIAGMSIVLLLAMLLAEEIKRVLGHTGQQVLTRIMGLILLALSVEFIVVGIQNVFQIGS